MSIETFVGIETEFAGLTHKQDRTHCGSGEEIISAYLSYLRQKHPRRGVVAQGKSKSNLFLSNGAKFYPDTGKHAEYATPESSTILDVIRYDKAGERIIELAADHFNRTNPGITIEIYKNNSDESTRSSTRYKRSETQTYGCHENYLIESSLYENVDDLEYKLAPFLITRQLYAGSGKIGQRYFSEEQNIFQLSQRADFMENIFGKCSTSERPLIFRRDEHHIRKGKRLHVLCGDSNLMEIANYLKIGTTELVLRAIEEGHIEEIRVMDSHYEMGRISRDQSMKWQGIRLEDGREFSALDIQRIYFELIYKNYYNKRNEETNEIIKWWDLLLCALEEPLGYGFRLLSRTTDWGAKLSIIKRKMKRTPEISSYDHPRIKRISIQYHKVDRKKGLYYILEKEERVQRILTDEQIEDAMVNPPPNNRAHFRGNAIMAGIVEIADWSITTIKSNGELYRIKLDEPRTGTNITREDFQLPPQELILKLRNQGFNVERTQ